MLFSGIRVRKISPDWRDVTVELGLTWWNRNVVGTHFGGSLFAMTDPFFALMLRHNLGENYVVWDKTAEIDFISPGFGTVRANFHLPETRITDIRAATENGEKHLPAFRVEITDARGGPVANVRKTIYVRRKRVGEGLAAARE
jgi:acyl-coenzyme A thioesterase PaaI-like protein